jgi:UDP-2,3-diacylglucosamine hydrolase
MTAGRVGPHAAPTSNTKEAARKGAIRLERGAVRMVRLLPLPEGVGPGLLSCVTAAKPVLIASDAHLGGSTGDQERAFLAWLEHAACEASQIVLNGDVFDFWFEYRTGTTGGHEAVLAVLRRIVEAGVPVTLMGGNHDWWGGAFLRDQVGVEFLQEPVVRDLAGRRTLIAHGDGLGRGDLGYRVLKGVLRSRLVHSAFGALPPRVGDRLARGVSRTGHKWDVYTEGHLARSAALETWALERLRVQPELDLVLLGHTHVPLLRQAAPGRWYANSGDWVKHRSYLTLAAGRDPVLTEWSRS